jgi:hypothetical protein
MSEYDIGDVVRLTATFSNAAGAPTDTTAVLTVKKPDGTSSTPAVTHGTRGVYSSDVPIDQPGVWSYRFVGTGAVTSAGGGRLYVRRSETA